MLSLGLNDFLRVPAVGLGRSHPTLRPFSEGKKRLFWRRWEAYVQMQGVSLFPTTLSNLG